MHFGFKSELVPKPRFCSTKPRSPWHENFVVESIIIFIKVKSIIIFIKVNINMIISSKLTLKNIKPVLERWLLMDLD